MNKIVVLASLLVATFGFSQEKEIDSVKPTQDVEVLNSAGRMLQGNLDSRITIGGYAQIDYNQADGNQNKSGKLDVHRMVLLFGYKFNDQVNFITEIEMEHVKELYVEQAFINYSLTDNVNLKAGLMLVPMGLVNEYHEPTVFNGVERPNVDKYIVPTTWREIGFGVSGKFDDLSLKYQAYIFNGFRSVGLGGEKGLRGGRQKGAESIINSPTLSTKVDYYGIKGLRLGLSTYLGDTQPDELIEDARGAKVMVKMIGGDARYSYKKFKARGQYIYTFISGSENYNILNGTDLGSELRGWYLEGSYNVLPKTYEKKLYIFTRYEDYDTHAAVSGTAVSSDLYRRKEITTGLSFHIAPGAVVKADYQFLNTDANNAATGQLNIGFGVWF